MKTKTLVLTVILGAGMLFTGCEKEEAQSPSNSLSADSGLLKKSNTQQKNGLYSEQELLDFIEEMDEETAVVVSEVSPDQYSITSAPFNPNNINNPANSNMVWPNNPWGRVGAWAEMQQIKADGCKPHVDMAYGMIAVSIKSCD